MPVHNGGLGACAIIAATRTGSRSRFPARVLAAACVLMGVVTSPQSSPVEATTIVPFASRFTTNDNGAIAMIGNNVLTCPESAAGCTTAQTSGGSGASSSNNAYSMINVDEDGAGSETFNSSSAQLSLPAGATALFAGLYWGARPANACGGNTPNPIDQMQLRVPGASAYQTVPAQAGSGPTATADRASSGSPT